MASPSILAVGSAVLDRVYTLSNLPEPDGGAFVREYAERGGGVAANVACGLAALDYDVGLVSRVGDDEAGQTVLDSLQPWDVETTGVHRGADPTSYTLILRGPAGRRMIVAGGQSVPNLRLTADDRERLGSARCVFTSAYAPEPVTSELVSMGRDGEISCLTFDLAGPLAELEDRGTTPATIDRAAAVADLFVTNRVAAESYLGTGPEKTADRIRETGADRVAVTMGADGAMLAATDRAPFHVSAPETDVIDTTGAGDQFSAALLHAWVLEGRSPQIAGHIAASAAARNCTAHGPRGSLATRETLPD